MDDYRAVLNHVTIELQGNSVLMDLSIQLEKGHIYGLVSQNGVGKTTLLKVTAGILAVTKGSVDYNKDVRIGYSIDDSLLFDDLTVEQNISYYAKLCGLYKKTDIEMIIEYIEAKDYRKKYVKKLSTGMKQRTSIGVSLIRNPNLLLWDEAISGVDILSRKEISGRLVTMAKEDGACIVIADHNLSNLLQICSDFIFLKKDGSVHQLEKEQLLAENVEQNQAEKIFIDILENKSHGFDTGRNI